MSRIGKLGGTQHSIYFFNAVRLSNILKRSLIHICIHEIIYFNLTLLHPYKDLFMKYINFICLEKTLQLTKRFGIKYFPLDIYFVFANTYIQEMQLGGASKEEKKCRGQISTV